MELRKLTEFCDFGYSINDMLRDKFVSGLHNTRTQHRLLAEKTLTFPKPQEMELADKDVQSLQSNPHTPVLKLNEQHTSTQRNSRRNVTQHITRHRNPQILPCHRCGGKHRSSTCCLKLHNVMCVARLFIFLECAATDSTEVVESVDTQQMW